MLAAAAVVGDWGSVKKILRHLKSPTLQTTGIDVASVVLSTLQAVSRLERGLPATSQHGDNPADKARTAPSRNLPHYWSVCVCT